MSGPPPQPTALRVLKGNPSKRALNASEPTPGVVRGRVAPPSWLPVGAARRHWRALVPVLQRMAVLTEADLDAAAMLCNELATYGELQATLAREGRTYEVVTKSGVMRLTRPEVGIANSAAAAFTKLTDRFGLNPAYRSKLKIEAEREVDPLDALRDDDSRAG